MKINVATFMYLLFLEQAGVFEDHGVCRYCVSQFDRSELFSKANKEFWKIPPSSTKKVAEINWS